MREALSAAGGFPFQRGTQAIDIERQKQQSLFPAKCFSSVAFSCVPRDRWMNPSRSSSAEPVKTPPPRGVPLGCARDLVDHFAHQDGYP